MPRSLAPLLAAAALALTAAAPAPAAVELRAGRGVTLRVESEPFRLALVDRAGRTTLATVPGRAGAPARPPGADGPQPLEPLGPVGGFPALGFVLGARTGATVPVGFFAGNRLFGVEAGGLASVVGVREIRRRRDGLDLALATDAPGAGPARLAVRRLRRGGVRLDLEPPANLPVRSVLLTLASPPGEALYGLGARKDAFDQRGRLRNVWVEQQNAGAGPAEPVTAADPTGTTGRDYTFPNGAQAAYYVQAALFGARGWAAWVGQPELSRLDLAHSRPDAVRWGVAAPRLTLFLAGGGLERASRAYTGVTGRAPAPPRWAYEPWIDVINEGEGEAAPNGAGFTGGPRVRRELEAIVRAARRHRVPIGVLGVEGWHKVADAERFFPRLRAAGFHLSAYWNPFTARGTAAYDEALARGLFVRDPLGQPYPIVTNRGNPSYVIDFSHPGAAAFWARQIARSSRLGFEGFMHDFGEFVTEGMRFHNGWPPERMHNAYPVLYHRAAGRALRAWSRRTPGFHGFFYVRAGFGGVGGGRGVVAETPAVFPGDETTDWTQGSGLPSVVPAMLNLALGGAYAFTTDVGGYLDLYSPRTTPELLVRWSQLAAFTPISRIHNSTGKGSLLPWEAGPAALDAYRRYARAKVRLIPLVDAYARRAARTGAVGPVRPLALEDPSPAAARVDDAWLLGRTLLVAPVLAPGATARDVYLPRGARWQPVRVGRDGRLVPAGRARAGGRVVSAAAPLRDIPLFRRVIGGRLRLRCRGGALAVRLRGGDLAGVRRVELRAGDRVLARAARPFRARLAAPADGQRVRARLELEDGRRVWRSARAPRCP